MSINSGTPPNTMFFPWGGFMTNTVAIAVLTQANQVQISGFYLPEPTVFSNIVVKVANSDNANNYDWGIYDSSGKLKAHVGAQVIAGTGILDVAVVGAPILLPAGKYYFAFTGAATTARLAETDSGASGSQVSFLLVTESVTTSAGGELPSTITIPSDNWASAAAGLHAFVLH